LCYSGTSQLTCSIVALLVSKTLSQYQFCITQKSNKDNCTTLDGLPSQFSQEDFPTATQTQIAMLQLLWTASLIFDLTNAPGQGILQAPEISRGYSEYTLPNNQWEKEVIGWESYAWAGIQYAILDFILGPVRRDPRAKEYANSPNSDGEMHLCKMLKVRKSGGFA